VAITAVANCFAALGVGHTKCAWSPVSYQLICLICRRLHNPFVVTASTQCLFDCLSIYSLLGNLQLTHCRNCTNDRNMRWVVSSCIGQITIEISGYLCPHLNGGKACNQFEISLGVVGQLLHLPGPAPDSELCSSIWSHLISAIDSVAHYADQLTHRSDPLRPLPTTCRHRWTFSGPIHVTPKGTRQKELPNC